MQMASASNFKTLRELHDDVSGDEVLARLKLAASSFLPEGWEDWRVREDVSVDLDSATLNKLRFCLPATEIAKAFDPSASSLKDKPYRDMKVKMLSWPFCLGLVLGPPSLALQIRGSALHCELVAHATNGIKHLLLTRNEASRALGQVSDSETDKSIEPASTRKRISSASRIEALEREGKATRLLLQEILSRLDNTNQDSSNSEQDEGRDDASSDDESDSTKPWNPPEFSVPSQKDPVIDFSPNTKEADPVIPLPDPEIKAQGFACQRIGDEAWNRIRYSDVQKILRAAPVFSALAVNPPLKHLAPTNSLADYQEKTEGAYGTITHAALLERAALQRDLNRVIDLCPAASEAIASVFRTGSNGEFRQCSDNLLQFVCGKRAETIELRRKAISPLKEHVASSLMSIPISENFLFDEKKLEELSKSSSTNFDAFKFRSPYKRKLVPNNQDSQKFTPKKRKFRKDNKENQGGREFKHSSAKQNRAYDRKSSHKQERFQKNGRPSTSKRF